MKRPLRRTITSAQVRSLDLKAQNEYGFGVSMLMENAGRAVAEEALKVIKRLNKKSILIVCGKGNNGGDGLVAARHLLASGKRPEILLAGRAGDLKDLPRHNLQVLLKLKQRIVEAGPRDIARIKRKTGKSDLIIDALFGVGLKGQIRGVYKDIIESINRSKAYVISVDMPSGLDADNGRVLGVSVKADRTVTFVAAKPGMFLGRGAGLCGRVSVRNLGIPL